MREPVIEQRLAEELGQYRGRWVAVDPDVKKERRVVASGDSVSEVLGLALQKGVTDPIVFRVPTHPERLNVF